MRKRAQHLAEYAIVIGMVTAAVVGMRMYATHAVGGALQSASDTMLGTLEPEPMDTRVMRSRVATRSGSEGVVGGSYLTESETKSESEGHIIMDWSETHLSEDPTSHTAEAWRDK